MLGVEPGVASAEEEERIGGQRRVGEHRPRRDRQQNRDTQVSGEASGETGKERSVRCPNGVPGFG